jgi:hypothetical protein
MDFFFGNLILPRSVPKHCKIRIAKRLRSLTSPKVSNSPDGQNWKIGSKRHDLARIEYPEVEGIFEEDEEKLNSFFGWSQKEMNDAHKKHVMF